MATTATCMRPVRGVASLAAVVALIGALSAVVSAPAGAKSSKVPTCAWAPAKDVSKTIGEPVRARAGVWSTVTAPVLTCAYVERQPLLQAANVPILQIRFAETQTVSKGSKSKKVKKLGHCATQPCPVKGAAAWLSVTYTRKPAIYSFRYVSGVDLRVQDGLNAIEIVLATPDGPMPAGDPVTRIEALMRLLLPKFAVH
jgi:hypothetical protein